MKSMKDWIVSQLAFPLLAALRPNFGNDTSRYQESSSERSHSQGTSNPSNLHGSANASMSSEHIHANQQEVPTRGHTRQSHTNSEPMSEIERILVNFLRLIMRLGQPLDDDMVSKVLHRLHLAALIRSRDSDMGKTTVDSDRCKVTAIEQESSGSPEVDFSIRILLIGRTGAGKSATINSIFGHTKATTNAFEPATNQIHEVMGTLHGIKVSLIDTPGLFPFSTNNLKENRKILLSIKRYIRKSPPDLVLYLERMDLVGTGFSDFSLLNLVSDVFGYAIWFNTMIVMTHSSSDLPEGPNGYPVSYESYSSHCKDVLRRCIHRVLSDSRLQNPVIMVENHPRCKTNTAGERILPNGEAWKVRLMLLCICSKVLSDVNAILKFHRTLELGPRTRGRSVSLSNLLSSLLRRNGYGNEIDETLFSDEDDDYDQLPPIRMLPKHQFEKLSQSQKAAYLDELDYREKLYMKKQLKEHALRKGSGVDLEGNPEAVLLPDMVVPESFSLDCITHRYRCFASSDEWVIRPVLDLHGWDHDVGFDGINLDMTTEFGKSVRAYLTGQVSKDKRDLSVQSECCAVYHTPQETLSLGLDVQSSGESTIYTTHSFMKMKSFFGNRFGCGISATPVHGKFCVGTKVEDVIMIGKRVKFEVNAGRMAGLEDVAYGGSIGATFHGKDYPVRNDGINLGLTVLSFNRELVLGGNFRLEFPPRRGTRMAINMDMNSGKMGHICVKFTGSGCAEIGLLTAFSIFKFLLRRKDMQ